VDPTDYTDVDAQVRYSRAAERGKFAFLFLPDFLAHKATVCRKPRYSPWNPC
jgi:hypothetical protein